MNIVILTTQTPHHAYFVRRLAARFKIGRVFIETRRASAQFETMHSFETKRDSYERDAWFAGSDLSIADLAEIEIVENINDAEAVASLRTAAPDIILVFGTGKLHAEVINVVPEKIFNLHGGDPQRYRGLDTHLWAIYHKDFGGLVTSILNAKLTTVILSRGNAAVSRDMPLYALRKVNTEVCVNLVERALESLKSSGRLDTRAQVKPGRYYSFMPSVLKNICVRNFERHTQGLA